MTKQPPSLMHHCHYSSMAWADWKFDGFFLFCSAFKLNNKNADALIVRELSGCTSTRSLTMNSKFSTPPSAKPRAVLKFLVHCYIVNWSRAGKSWLFTRWMRLPLIKEQIMVNFHSNLEERKSEMSYQRNQKY